MSIEGRERRAAAIEKRKAYEAAHVRYAVRYQWRRRPEPHEDRQDWRSYRRWAVVPILFKTEDEAWAYLDATAFKNMQHNRKASASVSRVIIK